MGIIDQVTQMRKQNMSDSEINSALRGKFSPREIKDAIDRLDIKKAVGNTAENDPEGMDPPPAPGRYTQDQSQQDQNSEYTPNPEDYNQGYSQDYAPQPTPESQQDYYQQQYQGYDQGYQQGGSPNDTTVEIAEQVFDEKIREIAKKMDSLEELKTLSQTRIDHINDRLKKVESIIDRLQAAILEKVGSYGNDIGNIKKEMSMMQDTFSKTLGHVSKRSSESKSKKK